MVTEEFAAFMLTREHLVQEQEELEDRLRDTDRAILDAVAAEVARKFRECREDFPEDVNAWFELGCPSDLSWGPYCEPIHECPESPVGYCVYSDSADNPDSCVLCGEPFSRK